MKEYSHTILFDTAVENCNVDRHKTSIRDTQCYINKFVSTVKFFMSTKKISSGDTSDSWSSILDKFPMSYIYMTWIRNTTCDSL